jgi:hypothetical protein
MALFYILWYVLYLIATDPGTVAEVQGLGFSSPKIQGVTGGIRAILDRSMYP